MIENDEMIVHSVGVVGDAVRRSREEQGHSQRDFGDLAGAGRRFISELENGKPTVAFGLALKVLNMAGWELVVRRR